MKLIMLLSMLLPTSYMVVSNIDMNDFEPYKTEMGLVLAMDKNHLREYKANIKQYLALIENCQRGEVKYNNPFFGTEGFYRVRGKNRFGHCILDVKNNDISMNNCALSKDKIDLIVKSKNNDLDNNRGIEFFNNYENAAYYDSGYCKIEYFNVIDENSNRDDLNQLLKDNPQLKSMLELMPKN